MVDTIGAKAHSVLPPLPPIINSESSTSTFALALLLLSMPLLVALCWYLRCFCSCVCPYSFIAAVSEIAVFTYVVVGATATSGMAPWMIASSLDLLAGIVTNLAMSTYCEAPRPKAVSPRLNEKSSAAITGVRCSVMYLNVGCTLRCGGSGHFRQCSMASEL